MTEGTEAITTIHFVWMGLLALLVVIGIVAGVRMKRRRTEAQREVEVHAEEAGVDLVQPSADPVVEPATPSPPVIEGEGADAPLTQLKGLGPKVAARLGELGITQVGQLAMLSDDDAARIDADLGAFSGRMARDRWVEQARLLAAGDREGFERVFGRL